MSAQDFITVFFMGLAGSVHCVGMCGGIATLLGSQIKTGDKQTVKLFSFHLLYNVGRLFSYIIAGALIAILGGWISIAGESFNLPDISRFLIGLLTLMFAAYLLGWTVFLLPMEKLGRLLWVFIEPIAQKFLPVRTPAQAFILGMLWGWLPCGMVYVALSWSATAAEPLEGGLLMAAFGLGTMPAMMGLGVAGTYFNKMLRNTFIKKSAGILVLAYGLYLIFVTVMGTGSHSHH